MGAVCFLVDQRDSKILHGRVGATWSVVDLGWTGVPEIELRQAERRRYPVYRGGIAAARYQAVGLDHRRTGASHSGKHRTGNRIRSLALYRLPSVHALYPGTGHAAILPDGS